MFPEADSLKEEESLDHADRPSDKLLIHRSSTSGAL